MVYTIVSKYEKIKNKFIEDKCSFKDCNKKAIIRIIYDCSPLDSQSLFFCFYHHSSFASSYPFNAFILKEGRIEN